MNSLVSWPHLNVTWSLVPISHVTTYVAWGSIATTKVDISGADDSLWAKSVFQGSIIYETHFLFYFIYSDI